MSYEEALWNEGYDCAKQQFDSDLATARRLIAEAEERARTAEADAAALRAKLADLIADDNESLCNCGVLLPLFERNVRDIKALLAADHPGAVFLAELEAARTVVEAAREAKKHQPLRKVLRDALAAYDAARGRGERE